ncbi:MAG: cobalamin biosynthesis protein [Methyloligella sp. ZOD6]
MMVAGFGCRKDVTGEAVAEALAMAAERCGIDPSQLDALATPAEKQHEAGFRDLATLLSLPLIAVEEEEMKQVAERALSLSSRVVALKGVPSVAETVALAAAGPSARLLAPRVASSSATLSSATCAIAVGDGP